MAKGHSYAKGTVTQKGTEKVSGAENTKGIFILSTARDERIVIA